MNKPLVTISIITYNQERYVREAVEGLLSQTYEPLEIVISDDHSTDRTWDIITNLVNAYRANGGIHKNIVLNRNEKNLGIVKNEQLTMSLKHGDLFVEGGGDDISLPNRVERIVEEWEKTGRQATVIHNGYIEIDTNGHELRTMPPRSAWMALGATASYARSVNDTFPPMGNGVSVEDYVYSRRALMLGPELQIPDVLSKYRVGSGVSTRFKNRREKWLLDAKRMIETCEQIEKDLETMRDRIEPSRYELVRGKTESQMQTAKISYALLTGKSSIERLSAARKYSVIGPHHATWFRRYIHNYVYVLPRWLADVQVNTYFAIKRFVHKNQGNGFW